MQGNFVSRGCKTALLASRGFYCVHPLVYDGDDLATFNEFAGGDFNIINATDAVAGDSNDTSVA